MKHKAIVEQMPDGWFWAYCLDTGEYRSFAANPDFDDYGSSFAYDRAVDCLFWQCPEEHEHAR